MARCFVAYLLCLLDALDRGLALSSASWTLMVFSYKEYGQRLIPSSQSHPMVEDLMKGL